MISTAYLNVDLQAFTALYETLALMIEEDLKNTSGPEGLRTLVSILDYEDPEKLKTVHISYLDSHPGTVPYKAAYPCRP